MKLGPSPTVGSGSCFYHNNFCKMSMTCDENLWYVVAVRDGNEFLYLSNFIGPWNWKNK